TAIVVCEVDRFGPCVSHPEKRTGPPPRELRLQRIIVCVSIWLDAGNIGIYPELNKRATCICSARSTGIYIDEPHLTYRARTNITHISHKPGWQLAFNEKVE